MIPILVLLIIIDKYILLFIYCKHNFLKISVSAKSPPKYTSVRTSLFGGLDGVSLLRASSRVTGVEGKLSEEDLCVGKIHLSENLTLIP